MEDVKTNFPSELPWDFTFTRCEYYVLKQGSAADMDVNEAAEESQNQLTEDNALSLNDQHIQLILLENWF